MQASPSCFVFLSFFSSFLLSYPILSHILSSVFPLLRLFMLPLMLLSSLLCVLTLLLLFHPFCHEHRRLGHSLVSSLSVFLSLCHALPDFLAVLGCELCSQTYLPVFSISMVMDTSD